MIFFHKVFALIAVGLGIAGLVLTALSIRQNEERKSKAISIIETAPSIYTADINESDGLLGIWKQMMDAPASEQSTFHMQRYGDSNLFELSISSDTPARALSLADEFSSHFVSEFNEHVNEHIAKRNPDSVELYGAWFAHIWQPSHIVDDNVQTLPIRDIVQLLSSCFLVVLGYMPLIHQGNK